MSADKLLEVLSVEVLRGSHSLHSSCASGLLGAGAVLRELVVLRALEVLLLLELPGVLKPLVSEVLVLEVLEVLGLVVLLELELLEVLELEVLLEPVLLWVLESALLVLLEVLLELVVLLELELTLGVLVLSLRVLEALRGRGRTTFRSFSKFLVSRLLLVLLLP
ncbi:unnamed protein product [Closterium sp. NIES-64]|nr:unnamed protein product [Closterium sp. NIES-64]